MAERPISKMGPSVSEHERAPLFECIERFKSNLKAPFYCPGHKGGRSLPEAFGQVLGEFDLNNLPDTDTLHCPSGPIHEAEILVADAYGVDRSFLMVGGSSLGNMAAVMAVARPGDKMLVQRNAHKSVIAGIIHSGAIPCWLAPTWDSRFGIAHGLSTHAVQTGIEEHPDAKGLVALNPTYFGVVGDIRSIASLCHDRNMVLIADEAHGPHFRFGRGYPVAAEDVGADIVIQSTHKILSGLSQAAVLHLQGGRVEHARLQASLQALQTTSPHFAIMASIDLARRQMMLEGESRLASMLELAELARTEIQSKCGLQVMGLEHALGAGTGFYSLDQTKLLIETTGIGWTGSDAQRYLNREHGVQPELSGPGYLLCILTLGSIAEDVKQLVQALTAMRGAKSPKQDGDFQLSELYDLAGRVCQLLPEAVISPRDAFYAPQRAVSLEDAVDRVSGEIITPYPPGIPILMPGERFNLDTIELLKRVKSSGCPISAVSPDLSTVRVVA